MHQRERGTSFRNRWIFSWYVANFTCLPHHSFIEFYTQLSLFFADLLQAIGSVMDLKWVVNGHLEVGEFCSAQGDFLLPRCLDNARDVIILP